MNQFTTASDETAAIWADNSVNQLFRQLERIDLLLQQRVGQIQQRQNSHVLDAFILLPEEVEERLLAPQGAPHWSTITVQWTNDASALDVGDCDLPDQLVESFDLTDFEKDVLLGLLPYFDSRYFSLFSAVQCAQQKRWPSFELALSLLCAYPLEKTVQEVSFLSQSPLLKFQLLSLEKKGEQQGEGWNQTLFKTDIGLYYFLTGRCHLPASLVSAEWLTVADHSEALCPPAGSAGLAAQLTTDADEARPLLMLRGGLGSGRTLAITTAAMALSCNTLQLDVACLPDNDKDAQFLFAQFLRETRLHAAYLLIRSLDTLTAERKGLLAAFAQQLNQPGLQVVCLCEPQTAMIWLPYVQQLVVDMPVLDVADKEALLHRSLGPTTAMGIDVAALCRRLHFTPQTLPQILKEAEIYRILRDPAATLSDVDLRKAFRLRSQQNFGNLTRRIEPQAHVRGPHRRGGVTPTACRNPDRRLSTVTT